MNDIQAFANRLNKNLRHLGKWARRHHIQAWRLYDRDIPQYPFAIDLYGDHVHLQEYDTGWLMSDADYAHWLNQVQQTLAQTLQLPPTHIHHKQRRRQKGLNQYEKTGHTGPDFIVHENGRAFWVNLDKYLDTGLFLDHRNTRNLIGQQATGKRFLNLFAYTGSFSVYAATGGATYSETVDLSNTYLDWAQRNFALNRIDPQAHPLIRADVSAYLDEAIAQNKQFDLIVIDPPSFSNSKKTPHTLDIQRDHPNLLHRCMQLLAPNGHLYFSNNLRGFTLDPQLNNHYHCQNISHQSVPEDFRNRKIHQCWHIRHR